jgi:putative resolvase
MSCTQSSVLSSARLVPIGQAAALANVHVDTIREYMSRGEIEGMVTPGGHRRINLQSVAECFGVSLPAEAGESPDDSQNDGNRLTILWGRVSSSKQRLAGDLARQVKDVQAYAAEHYPGERTKVIQGVGSGINLERPELLQLISLVTEGKVARIVCTFQERLMRTGLALLKHLCKVNGTEIVEIGEAEREKTLEDDMVASVLAIMNIFVAKKNGSRGAARTKTFYPAGFRERVAALAGAGLSRRDVVQQIAKDQPAWKCENTGKSLATERAVRRVIDSMGNTTVIPATVKTFIRKCCALGVAKSESTENLYSAYCQHCAKHSARPLTRDKWTQLTKRAVPQFRIENGKQSVAYGLTLRAGRPA